MKPAHFLNLRWRQDYRFVTELRGRGVGPLEQVGLRLQQTKPDPWALYEETIVGVGDVITLFGRKFLEFDGRRAVWQHSLVYPLGTLDRAAARGILRAAYGGDPGLLLPVLYELLAPLEHWEGDPLARRMFLDAPTTASEPIAATLIRELWSSRQPPVPDLAAQLHTLEGLLVGGAPGVLDLPTSEELEALSAGRLVVVGAPPIPSVEDPPSWGAPALATVEGDVEEGSGAHGAHGAHGAQWSPTEDASKTWSVAVPAAAEPLPDLLPERAAQADTTGTARIAHVHPDGALDKGWPSPSREAMPFDEAVFCLPTQETAPEQEELDLELSAEPTDASVVESPIVEAPIVEAPAQRSPTAPLSRVELAVDDVDDDDDEDDDKTVISPVTASAPGASKLNDLSTRIDLPRLGALSEAETRLNIPVPTPAQLAALTALPAAPQDEASGPHTKEPQEPKAGDDPKRPMIIGALVGFITALLALAIVWSRTGPQADPAAGEAQTTAQEALAGPITAPPPAPPPEGTDAAGDIVKPDGPHAPSAPEIPCYTDKDGDGHGHKAPKPSLADGDCPAGMAKKGGDCNDNDPLVYPGAEELCDGEDNNCNSKVDDNDSLRDDNDDGKKDCSQTDPANGIGPLKLSGEVKGGTNGQAPYLLVSVGLPEGSRGACKQELVFGRGVAGSLKGAKSTFIIARQSCGVPVEGGALPKGLSACVKGMTIAVGAESVAVEAKCCMQNQNSYGSYLASNRRDGGLMEFCGYLETSGTFDVKVATATTTAPTPAANDNPETPTPP